MLGVGHLSNTRLDFSGRSLKAVPTAEIEPVADRLCTLDLSSNELTAPLTLPHLPQLMELRLADNALDAATLQRAAPLPPALRVLDLSANRVTVLPPAVLRLASLTVLKLDRQRLRSLPPQLSLLSELVELDAGFNEIETALQLQPAGLPSLRRLVLRSNALARGKLTLDPEALPSLTELDLAGNGLAFWPADVGNLAELRTLCLSNNRLSSLVSDSTVPNRRMWVPSAGLHTLAHLVELSVAQNALSELPTSLQQLRALRRLDVRCNPLSERSFALAVSHCEQCHARLYATSLRRAADGILLGDQSSAWHKPTLLRAHVSRVLSIGAVPPDGVSLSRLAAKYPEELQMLGLVGPEVAGGEAGAAGLVTVESLRKAFRAAALRLHPDKQPAETRDQAAGLFTRLQDAYRVIGCAVAAERRRLPQFEELIYTYVDLPLRVASESEDEAAASLASSLRTQLPAAVAFAAEARKAADGDLLVHASGGAAAAALALAAAILIERGEAVSVEGALRQLGGALGGQAAAADSTASQSPAGESVGERAGRAAASAAGLPASMHKVLSEWLLELRASRLQIVHEQGSRVSQAGADSSEPPPNGHGGVRPTQRVNESARPPVSGGARSGSRRAYAPQLSMVDPFGADEGGVADPLAELNDDWRHVQTLSPLADEEATGGGMMHEATGGGLMHEGPQASSDVGAADFSSFDIDTGSRMPVAPPPLAPGWHVDAQGRNVLHVAGSGRGRYNFSSVVVEHEPGARMGHASRGADGDAPTAAEAEGGAGAMRSTAC